MLPKWLRASKMAYQNRMNLGQKLRFSLRMLRREWRAGDVSTLALASFMAVACLTTVLFFVDRLEQALQLQASELMAADLRYSSDQAIDPGLLRALDQTGLRRAGYVAFRSMLLFQGKPKLVELKAVQPGYPLRGKLRLLDNSGSRLSQQQAPQAGTVWIDSRLQKQLAIPMGGQLRIGDAEFRLSAIIEQEPDRAGDMFSIAPRAMIAQSDLAATGLVQAGSRIRYVVLLAGKRSGLERAKQVLDAKLGPGDKLETVNEARGEVRVSMLRARQFFGLVAVISVILSITAIAICARRFAERNSQVFAVMCCLGARSRDVLQSFVIQLMIVAGLAGIFGSVCGWLLHQVLAGIIGRMLLLNLPAPSLWPALPGLLVAFAASLLVATPPVMRLRKISVVQALKAEHASLSASGGVSYLLGLALVFGLIYWLAGDSRMAGILSLSLSATLVLLALSTLALLWILRRIPLRRLNVWVMGLRHLLRHPWQNLIQILAFGVSIMAVVLLTMLRNDLLSIWQEGLPEDIPNRFIINIQAQQKDAIQAYWQDQLDRRLDFYPLVRARISRVKGQAVADMSRTPQQHGLLDHDFKLSWQTQLNAANTLVSGHWWRPQDSAKALVSVEQGMAQTLGLTLGDSLSFSIEGRDMTFTVASIRKVKWDSFQPNFYVLLNPGLLPEQSASNITSVYVPAAKEAALDGLINRFPNLTVINASDIIRHVRSISAKVSMAIEFMFVLTLVSGAVLLLAAIRVSYEQRKHETAIQRALGVSRQKVLRAIAAEFALIGVLAGFIGMFFSNITATVMAEEIFQRSYVPSPWYWIVSLVLAAGLTATLGLLSLRPILRVSPMQSLKSA